MIITMRIESPLCLYTGVVPPEWIDYNGHMNVAYYVLAFDHATDAFLDYLGMGPGYRDREGCSAFVVETHVNYQRELVAGDPMRITTQLLGFDSKRLHYFHRLYHARKGFLAATTQHIQLPQPPQSGRVIGVRAKSPTIQPEMASLRRLSR